MPFKHFLSSAAIFTLIFFSCVKQPTYSISLRNVSGEIKRDAALTIDGFTSVPFYLDPGAERTELGIKLKNIQHGTIRWKTVGGDQIERQVSLTDVPAKSGSIVIELLDGNEVKATFVPSQ